MAHGGAIVTVVTSNYFHFALTLAQSCRKWMADYDFYTVVIDRNQTQLSDPKIPNSEHVIAADSIGIENWNRYSFQYSPFELACSMKPFAMRHLARMGYERVVYLDSDMWVRSRLSSIESALEQHSIVLSPHLLQPLPSDSERPDEKLFLASGAFNGGLVACQTSPDGACFLDWWSERMQQDGYVDIARGVFADQKWLDLAPAMFDGVGIHRNPGCNTGYWTLCQFPLSGDSESGFSVGQHPLECFHFSQMLPTNPYEFLRSQSRVTLENSPSLAELIRSYHAAVELHKPSRYTRLEPGLTKLSTGVSIRPQWREAIRRNHTELVDVENPFDVSTSPKLLSRFRQLEKKSKKWRGDWQIRSPSKSDRPGLWRRLKNRWRHGRSQQSSH